VNRDTTINCSVLIVSVTGVNRDTWGVFKKYSDYTAEKKHFKNDHDNTKKLN